MKEATTKEKLIAYFQEHAENTGTALVLRTTEHLPENHGYQTGSNNGNYAYGMIFVVNFDGTLELKDWRTSDGDLTVPSEYKAVSEDDFYKALLFSLGDEEKEFNS